jgi:RHS repeat-associated protein
MGARFYAPDLGLWTSGDPEAIAHPERLVTAEFAAANPYAYANLTPVVAADRDGHFWNVVLGAGFGGAASAAIEAARQYFTTGKIDDFGRIGAAAAGGAVAGAVWALNPAAGLTQVFATGARSGVAAGLTERLVASGGKDAGTLKDVAVDAAIGGATGAVAKGVTAAVAKVGPRVAAGVRTPLGTRTSNPTRNGASLYRYVSEGELGAIRETGLLRGGNPGRTYFTPQKFTSASRAQERLALPTEPTHRVEFEILNEPRVRGPSKVLPDNSQPGRGIELFSNDQVEVRVLNVQPLLPPK